MRVLVATGQVATGEKGWLQVVGYSWLQASLNTVAAQASGLATALVTGSLLFESYRCPAKHDSLVKSPIRQKVHISIATSDID